jgi:hypothetical protein
LAGAGVVETGALGVEELGVDNFSPDDVTGDVDAEEADLVAIGVDYITARNLTQLPLQIAKQEQMCYPLRHGELIRGS